jgi:hypothetical protein
MALPDVKALSTPELDELLKQVALERVKRQPEVSMDQPQTMEAALDPRWFLSLADANTVLQLRHPGYGWVGYVLPPASRASLAAFLLQHSLLQPNKPEAAKPDAVPPAPPVVAGGGGTIH